MTIVLAARRARGHIKGMTIRTTPDDILPTYQREALAFQATRNKSLFEK
jgi:hypothetical protein